MSIFSLKNQVSNSSLKTLKSYKIDKIVFGGAGLTRQDGCVVFVPFSAPGDEVVLKIVTTKKSYKIATINQLKKNGKDRIHPRCPHYQNCGGCQFQHLSYEAQLEAKCSFVSEAIGFKINIEPSPKTWLYRSHIRLNLKKQKNGFSFGFIGNDNHSLVPISSCSIFSENNTLFEKLKNYLISLPNKGIQSGSLQIFKLIDDYLLAFSFFPRLPLQTFPFSFAKGTVFKSPKEKMSFGETKIKKTFLGLSVQYSPYSFMQNNTPVAEKLYTNLIQWIGINPKRILDLYSGVGLVSTLLAQKGHKVIGVESNPASVKHSKIDKRSINARIICSSVEKVLLDLLESFEPQIIVVNPTRQGLSKKTMSLLGKSQELFYVSCMPPTLKRDLYSLKENFFIKQAVSFDMFPQTTHVETLVHMIKKE